MRLFLSLIIIFLSLNANALDIKFSGMAFYQSKRIYRGALTWDAPIAMAGISIRVNQKFVLRGPSLAYEMFEKKDNQTFNINLNYRDDGKPLIRLKDEQLSYRNKRKNSLESTVVYKYKFGFRNLFFVGGSFSRDYISFKDIYYELQAGTPILPFISLKLAIGNGGLETNKHIFGPSAQKGWGHYRYQITGVMPFVPWDGIIINTFSTTKIIGSANRGADYIRGEAKNSSFASRVIWNF